MKDINKLKNYRIKYKRYYEIDFSNEYEIHHIDLDHTNNDISNLLLLPKELHRKYHYYLNVTAHPLREEKIERTINITLNDFDPYYNIDEIKKLIEVINECQKWIAYKNQLEYKRYYKRIGIYDVNN